MLRSVGVLLLLAFLKRQNRLRLHNKYLKKHRNTSVHLILTSSDEWTYFLFSYSLLFFFFPEISKPQLLCLHMPSVSMHFTGIQSRLGFCDQGPMWYCVPKLSVINEQLSYDYYTMPLEEEVLLRSGRYDILVSSDYLDAPDIVSRPFLHEKKYLSVAASHPLAGETSISARDPRIKSILLFILNGTFDKKQMPFWDSVKEQTNITTTTDYFLFSQMIKDPKIITTTTELVKHYRNDGSDRVLIPLTDPNLTIDYHISYLKSEEQRLKEMILLLEHSAE